MTMRLLVDVVVVVVADVVVDVLLSSLLSASVVVVVVKFMLAGAMLVWHIGLRHCSVDVVRSLLSFIVVNVTGRHQSWETRGVDEVYRDRTSFRAGTRGNIGDSTANVSSICRLLSFVVAIVVARGAPLEPALAIVVVVVADVSDGRSITLR